MKDCTCTVIAPDGRKTIIPYYCLEIYCKKLVGEYLIDNSISQEDSRKRKIVWTNWEQQYAHFSPYFDFVFLYLEYKLERPMLIPNTSLIKNEKEEYFVQYDHSIQELPYYLQKEFQNPLWLTGKEDNIIWKNLPEDLRDIPECFIDGTGQMIYLKSTVALHNFWANMWIHEQLKKDKFFCLQYLENLDEYGMPYTEPSTILMEQYPWMRLARVTTPEKNDTILLVYCSNRTTEKQKNVITKLQKEGLLLTRNLLDIK